MLVPLYTFHLIPPPVIYLPLPPARRTALYLAAKLGHADVARAEILCGADVNNRDPEEQCTVLEIAVYKGHVHIVNDLLMRGADPNTRNHWNRTALHTAVIKGYNRIAAALITSGSAVNALDGMGESPLIKAAHLGYQQMVIALLAGGADVNIRGTGPSRYSALDRAAQYGHVSVIQTLLGRGVLVNSTDYRGVAAIHVAALHGRVEAVDTLVAAGANIKLQDYRGWTPVFFAARRSNHEVLLALLERGATLDVRTKSKTTPLHQACYGQCEGLEATVKLLLERGVDTKALDDRRRAPVDMIDTHDGEDGAGLAGVDDGGEEEEEEEQEVLCPQDELDRVGRLLLSSRPPPTDVTWRRRSWLVMLRSRLSKGKTAADGASGGSTGDGSDVPVNREEGKRHKVAKGESAGGAERCAPVEVSGNGDGASVDTSNGGGLSEVIGWLAELERETLFRAVLGFL